MRWRWWYAAAAEAGVVRVVVRVGGSGCEGDVGGSASAVVGGFSGDGSSGVVVVRGMVMVAAGVAAAVGWLGWCEGGVEVAAMVMLVTYGGEEGDDGVVVRGDGVGGVVLSGGGGRGVGTKGRGVAARVFPNLESKQYFSKFYVVCRVVLLMNLQLVVASP
ncbi:hypothetical protein Tco_0536277 [Tanacetum coccineum]